MNSPCDKVLHIELSTLSFRGLLRPKNLGLIDSEELYHLLNKIFRNSNKFLNVTFLNTYYSRVV